MKPYDTFEHVYEHNAHWIYNRILFLLYMQEHSNERFHGGDGKTAEEMMANYKDSFAPELDELLKKQPILYNKAFASWLDNDKPQYLEVK